jgi:arylsulfatase A-like enzyme
MTSRSGKTMPDVITLPQLCKEAGWQSHAYGKLLHLGGGRDAAARQRWMDSGKSWHTAQAFEATKTGRKMLDGRNVTGERLTWCQWGAADGAPTTISRMVRSPPPRWR